MTYQELIDKLAESRDISKRDAKEMVEGVFGTLKIELGKGVGVSIPQLGTFSTTSKESRKVYSPHHKKYMIAPSKRVVDFTPSAALKEKLKFLELNNE